MSHCSEDSAIDHYNLRFRNTLFDEDYMQNTKKMCISYLAYFLPQFL